MVAAHRGVATGAAENTIDAFTNAIAVGADMIEFDVRHTRDGELIAFHDAQVNGQPIGGLTRDEIESAKGVRPPLLDEVLKTCAGHIRLDVELKEDGYVADVMAAIKATIDVEQVVVTSFLPAVVAQAKDALPAVKTGLLVGTDAPFHHVQTHYKQVFPIAIARRARADYLAPHYKLADFGVIRRAAAVGLPCLLWTVNEAADIRRFAADPRVAAIITDEAAKALRIVAEAQEAFLYQDVPGTPKHVGVVGLPGPYFLLKADGGRGPLCGWKMDSVVTHTSAVPTFGAGAFWLAGRMRDRPAGEQVRCAIDHALAGTNTQSTHLVAWVALGPGSAVRVEN
jgi:glycerophosphoryl diester phosphodiesterase